MEYRSPKTLSILAICGLAACLLLQVLMGFAGLAQILGPERPFSGSGMSIPVMVESVAGTTYTLAYFFSAVVFLIWLFRAHKNLQFLKADFLDFTPGWTVGWWFVPFATFWKPFQAVREVWAESNPEFDPDEPQYLTYSLHSAPPYMVVWWIAWLVMLIGLNVGNGLIKMPGLTTINFGAIVFFQAVIVSFAAVMAIIVIRDITARQDARHARLGVGLGQLPPPPPTFDQGE